MENARRGAEGRPPAPDEFWWAAVLGEAAPPESASAPAGTAADWEWARALFENDQPVELPVIGHNRGGLLVEARSLRGFVPVSHLCSFDPRHGESEKLQLLASQAGRSISLKVIEVEPGRGRFVLSERAALAAPGERNRLLKCLAPGEVVQGVVTNITPFGVFVDLGGLEGLVHISELAWSRVRHPEDLVRCGEELETQVLSVDPEQCRVALSLRALQPDPWQQVGRRYRVGDIVHGTVTNVVRFGAFVGLDDGLEGLIHSSEYDDAHHAGGSPLPGERLAVRVTSVDAGARRIGLSLRSIAA